MDSRVVLRVRVNRGEERIVVKLIHCDKIAPNTVLLTSRQYAVMVQ